MVSSQIAPFDQFHRKNHTCKHYHVSCTKWIPKGIAQGIVLKDALFECGDHLQNTHSPLTFKLEISTSI
jgi:hypothetical protein